jgi:hypothetical protein
MKSSISRSAASLFTTLEGASPPAHPHGRRARMLRLIDAELAATGQRDLRKPTPALILHWRAGDVVRFHLLDERVDVIAHQIELVHIVLVRMVDGDLGRRHAKDQPSIANIDMREPEDVAEKRAIGLSVRAVDNRMRPCEHGQTLLI